ncbi:MAG: class I SAM-dependent methyltransferase [Actinomycetota bacterium]
MTNLPPPPDDWYIGLARHLGEAYLRYEFTTGTTQEVDFIAETLATAEGERLLDVGCGPGRHSVEFAKRGLLVTGVDISPEFIALAHQASAEAGVTPSFFQMDTRELPFETEFDVAICLNEGGFGLGLPDLKILRAIRRSLKHGGRLALGAANVFYVLKHGGVLGPPSEPLPVGALPAESEFDPVKMLYKARVDAVEGAAGEPASFEMWTSCYTPRELEWIANGAGLDPEAVFGIAPGAYGRDRPTMEHPELLLIARRP